MPQHIYMDAPAQSTVSTAITAAQTSVTLLSASGFTAPTTTQQFSVVILDTGNPAFSASNPLATPFEYQQVNSVSGNVLQFGVAGGGASRVAYAGTTPKSFFAGATVAAVILAEDLNANSVMLTQTTAMVFQTTSQNFTGGSVTSIITYDTVESDPLSSWNNTNHQYTAPFAGRYLVTAALNTTSQTSTAFISIYKNAVEARRGNETGAQTFSWVVSAIVKCVAGDLLDVRYFNGGGLLGSGPGAAVTYAEFTFLGA